jgi:hypothetical protein
MESPLLRFVAVPFSALIDSIKSFTISIFLFINDQAQEKCGLFGVSMLSLTAIIQWIYQEGVNIS